MPDGARRAQYRKFDLCGECGDEPWRVGASLCLKHRKAATKRQKASRAKLGRPEWLRKRTTTLQAQVRKKRRLNGLCRECGTKVSKYTACLRHRLLDQSYRKKKAA